MKPIQIVALLSAVAVIGMGIQTLAGGRGTVLIPSSAPRVETKALRDIVSEDADQDGLPNWEELLWGTDPRKADSNGDGVQDGEDIARRRAKLSTPESAAALTETDRFARDFFATVVSLQSSGKLTDGTIESLSKGLAEKIGAVSTHNAYETHDIDVVAANKESLIAFGKAIVGISSKYAAYGLGTELASLENAITSKDRDAIMSLEKTRVLYLSLAREIAALPVPEPLVPQALDMANASVAMGNALHDIQSVFDDSTVALSALMSYTKSHGIFEEATRAIGEYYAKNAMIFDKK